MGDKEVLFQYDMLSCGGIQERRKGLCLLLVFKDIHSAYKKNK
jgi:hypothetical protein